MTAAILLTLIGSVTPIEAANLVSESAAQIISKKIRFALYGVQDGGFLRTAVNDLLLDFNDDAAAKIFVAFTHAVGNDTQNCEAGEVDLASAYSDILSNATWSKSLMTSSDRVELNAIKNKLFDTNGTALPEYEVFLKYKKIYDAAKAALDATPPDRRTAAQENAVKKAREDLAELGNSVKFVNTDSRYNALIKVSANSHFEGYRTKWPGQVSSARQSVSFSPPFGELTDENKWTSFAFKDSVDGLPQWAGGLLSISFKSARVRVIRTWFAEDLFSDDSWKYSTVVADGHGDGTIGRYVIELIFIKDLSIEVVSPSAARTAIRSGIFSNDRVQFGPFVIANRQANTAPFTAAVNKGAKAIQLNLVQLFGCQSNTLPRAPQPRPDYEW